MLKVINGGKQPTRGSKYSACIDLYANKDIIIGAGETVKVPLGVCLDYNKFPLYLKNNIDRHYLQLEPRSSLRAKGLQAGTGVIDLDYKGEICIILHNPTKVAYERAEDTSGYIECDDNFEINKGDKIAQIMLCKHKSYLFNIDTEKERKGGFGSTGE